MTSRRPMTRSFSGNGRQSSFGEEEGGSYNGRPETRNTYLSNVRPETRSTLCSVMAQLTDDVQPSFETTLKSKAVSENCNVKFTCVVSGYPAPELKWYKDDMQMDRYCGLPKYEIRRNGKTHTLHIYNCTLDDAAIYQVSASNSKGIVSCSGVLEVGTMSEYQIHQRFFAKLKQKAEKKKHDLEVQAKEDKENIQGEKPKTSPERPPRKRAMPALESKKPDAVEQQGAAAEANGVTSEVKETSPVKGIDLENKKIKISNGVDAGVNSNISRSHTMGNGGENCYDGGLSLAQFLAETLQSQAAEEKQNSPVGEKPKEMDTFNDSVSIEQIREQERLQKEREVEKALEEEHEKEKRKEEEMARERERVKPYEMSHTVPYSKPSSGAKHHSKAHKDHDHHIIQTSISSMLHSVKDFLFGKSKKDSHDHTEKKDREFDHSPASVQPPKPETPPSFRLQPGQRKVSKPLEEDVVPMQVDKPKESTETLNTPVSLEPLEDKHEASDLDLPPAYKPESVEKSTGQSVREVDAVEAMESSVGPECKGPEEETSLSPLQGLTEAEETLSQSVSVFKEIPMHQEEQRPIAVSQERYQQTTRDEGSTINMSVTQALLGGESSPTPLSSEESWTPPLSLTSTSDSHSLEVGSTKTLPEEDMSVEGMGKEGEPDVSLTLNKLCEEEKTEVKSINQSCSDINGSEMTELITASLEERIEPCESQTRDQVLSSLSSLAANSVEGESMKGEVEHASLIQEMNVGFPPTGAESLEEGDLKMQQKRTSSITMESTEGHKFGEIQSSNSGKSSEEGLDLKEVLGPAIEKDLESVSMDDVQTNGQAILEGESTEARTETLAFGVEAEPRNVMTVEELDHFKSSSKTLSKEYDACVEEQSNVAHQDSIERQKEWSPVKIPLIQISTIEDTLHNEPTVPDVNQYEQFIIPTIEIKEPECKEYTLPTTVLSLNMQEPAILQNHDITHVSEAVSQSVADSPCLLPTHKTMHSDHIPSLTEKVQDVAQLVDKTEICEQELSPVKELPQMDFALIPVINVSCTDDKGMDVGVNIHVSDSQEPSETPTVPLFVVPPISVTCHESDSTFRLPSRAELTETETSAATQRETKPHVDNNMTTFEKSVTQNHPEEIRDQGIKENPLSLLYESQIPKVGDNVPPFSKITEVNIFPEILKTKPIKDIKVENSVTADELQRNRLCSKPPTHPSLSPASLRKFMSRAAADSDNEAVTSTSPSDKADEDLSGGSTPTSSLSCESSPRLKRRDSLSLIRSATPEELASGARRKIYILKPKEDPEGTATAALEAQVKKENPYMSPSQARRAALLQAPTGQKTPPMERRSPLMSRRKITLEVPKLVEEPPKEEPAVTKQEEKPEKKLDPLKAPQVIRKIRGEPFPDASGHLKLWCQFFNVLSDSTIKWFKEEEEILEVKRSGGDESQVALAIVLASSEDCGVYGCSISNEYGSDNTDFLLSEDVLSDILLKDDLEVGEEIEMTPMLFAKGLSDSGSWGEKYFGRIMTETVHVGEGYAHKASRVKVIYGLDPIFESGSACIMKVQNPIPYGTKQESNLAERNLDITKKECKVQNMIREYCKIFAAEARVTENFGSSLEVIPQFLMYRPANTVPYATVEADLDGVFVQYCAIDPKGKLFTRVSSEVEQKCSTFQHWIHQWTHGNLLVTRLEGVDTKITNVKVVTKSKGYQGLTECGSPEVFEQFLTHHQCNYYCGLLGLHPLKSMDSQPSKMKRSPLLSRKLGSGSPQTQRKGQSPQMLRKTNASPKVTKKVKETVDNKSDTKPQPAQTVDVLETR